ncbi:AraC family transcriptional regulator [Burkholderia thailandensis]|nr:AraC family transcriptional regulator [Burkholderia thailandensis]AHI67127.1 helix-turn-helix domain protein [Burkholderia thailandensis H0587]AOJ53137.1 AraC family transcriptional regulator [Burkholderia thailandensis]AVR28747.1 AraC family transcriptional regulator [Burkholderia thailandensis]MCS3392863.1 AraC family transcriptional regulator [Burkholderia thailandensis]MCS6425665.1 AraC family transcriptional regulator [Burkholderia thailandensis]
MSIWDFTRSPASVRLMAGFGEERGLGATQLLAGAGLSVAQLDDPNVKVTAAQELRVAGNLLRLLKYPPGLGLQVGLRYHFSVYGVWGYGLIASATAGDALALALRFLPLTYAFASIAYRQEDGLGILSFSAPELNDEMKRFLVERDMAAAAVLLHEIGGDAFELARVAFKGERAPREPARAEEIRRAFGVAPEYSARSNCLVFERALLERPLPQANPVTVSMCEQMCQRLMDERRLRLGAAAMIRHYMNAAPGIVPSTLDDMARLMNTSSRTLKRRLQEEGTTFRALLADARSALASELLTGTDLSLTEIAERLGFSDLSSFSQAFKRWQGVAPSTFRSLAASDGSGDIVRREADGR